ncbi:DUF4962 domain-containing protein [Segetibacter sp. 3557_3]|uniref:heparinase II/III domain-containing protein n=1 Tax=Segetibacter sp. 3557_3 TaxID=2547429 RepID=UPI0010590658|nr:heparinase II/III family protein [Segetibacter sp. 3557_3]TDH28977.1 DUF4962 domain-containing protein [Segetibacter sp. 3557_3]
MKKRLNACLSICFLLIFSVATAQTDFTGAYQLPKHPRILMLAGEEQAIKKNASNDKTWTGLHKAIIAECDSMLLRPPVERIQIGRRLLDKSREALRRLFFLSYAYRLTREQQYAQRAEQEMLAISAFRDWNPSHFLDVAEMTMAMAIGYDWLYDQLQATSRSTIREAIVKKGIEPSLESKNGSFLRAEHNWNQVCNAGMAYGALAVYEDHPELAKQVINRAIETIVLPMKDYAPDGAYPEGYGYWGYGTSFNVMFINAIEKAYGNDFGLSDQPGFLKTAGFLENMTGPSHNPFNYSDAGSRGGLHPAMFWFASKLKDPSLLWVERSQLMNNKFSAHVKDRLLPAIMLWGAGSNMNRITAPKQLMWVGQGKNPVALMRTSWTDPNAIYVAMKGGSVSVNHAHMDIGSFIMEANGVRWAMDFGMQEYETLESRGIQLFGRTQDAQRWTVFRYTNLVHNTLTLNNQHQRVTGHAPITGSSAKPLFMNATVDMTEVYKGAIAKAVRGVGILNQKAVLVRDEVETLHEETTLRWTMLTPATVKITGSNRAELTKDGKSLLLEVQEPATVTMKTWSTDPPHDYDAPNPGTTLVGFEVKLPANSKSNISVLLVPEGDTKGLPGPQPLATWNK